MVEQSLALEHTAVALCDRDGLYGSVRAHVAARKSGHHHIVGSEMTLELSGQPRPYDEHPYPSVALLVENHAGYCSLCRLLTRAHADHEKGQAGISAAEIAGDCDGLFAIIPYDPRCPIPSVDLERLREGFAQRCAIASWRHLDRHDSLRLQHAERVAARHHMPMVASNRPLYHSRACKPLADVVHCIRLGTTLEEAKTKLAPNAEAELKSARAMHKLFAGHPDWVERSVDIAERCSFSLDEVHYHFPSEHSPSEHSPSEHSPSEHSPSEHSISSGCVDARTRCTPDETLRRAVEVGCDKRYPDGVPADVRNQLDKELRLIQELEVAPYFLSVQQIVEIARARRILCQGRGSAANSAVCYVLGITAVDPVRSSLLFERFMSSARKEPPDIDVDFEHERREEVIQEIYQRYGRDRAAMVSEVICYRGKSALREVGKVFGLSDDQLDRLSSIASHYNSEDGVSSKALSKRGLDPRDRSLSQVVRLAAKLQGFPRHLSIHVGGFVLSSEPLYTVAPVEPARMEGRTVIPWDKDDLEDLGFFKVDVLGLGMLTAIRKALAFIHQQQHGSLGQFDPIEALAKLPAADPAVYDACCKADTVGVFQIESRAQMAMLPILKPRTFYDLVVEVGIVRPGPIQGKMVHPFLRRRTGKEQVSYPHDCLKPVLERTLGVPLFQEQVMQIAIIGAGYDPGEADQLRRDMAAWRKNGHLKRHHRKLLDGFRANGIADEFGERLYSQILGFGEYGFPESHAASFALLVYASVWLKVHHPAAFTGALINSQPMGFYTPSSLVRDAQRHEVEVRPVRVEHSAWDCTLEYDEGVSDAPALRLGLRLVRGLSKAAAESIVSAREDTSHGERLFDSLDQFVDRTTLKRNELEILAEAGAFEGLLNCRRETLWRLRAPREEGLFEGQTIESDKRAGLPRVTAREQLSFDYATTGVSLHDHPIRHLRKKLRRRKVLMAMDQQRWKTGQRVTVAGVVLTRQRPSSASGVVFITLEDDTGSVNLVLYGHVFDRYELVARYSGMLLARGRVDRRGDVVHVRADYLERIDMPRGQSLMVRSRDFH